MYSFTVRSIEGMAGSIPSSRSGMADAEDDVSLRACLNHLGSMYSSRPSRPPSRPYPLSRYPPKPHAASKRLVQFTHTTPALSCAARSRATLMFSLQTQDASPYTVLFASPPASFGVRKVIAASTGPKISCCATIDVGCTLLKIVGGK